MRESITEKNLLMYIILGASVLMALSFFMPMITLPFFGEISMLRAAGVGKEFGIGNTTMYWLFFIFAIIGAAVSFVTNSRIRPTYIILLVVAILEAGLSGYAKSYFADKGAYLGVEIGMGLNFYFLAAVVALIVSIVGIVKPE